MHCRPFAQIELCVSALMLSHQVSVLARDRGLATRLPAASFSPTCVRTSARQTGQCLLSICPTFLVWSINNHSKTPELQHLPLAKYKHVLHANKTGNENHLQVRARISHILWSTIWRFFTALDACSKLSFDTKPRFSSPSGLSDSPVNETGFPLNRESPLPCKQNSKALFAIDSRRVTYILDVVHVSMRIASFIPFRLIFLWVPLESAF